MFINGENFCSIMAGAEPLRVSVENTPSFTFINDVGRLAETFSEQLKAGNKVQCIVFSCETGVGVWCSISQVKEESKGVSVFGTEPLFWTRVICIR